MVQIVKTQIQPEGWKVRRLLSKVPELRSPLHLLLA